MRFFIEAARIFWKSLKYIRNFLNFPEFFEKVLEFLNKVKKVL